MWDLTQVNNGLVVKDKSFIPVAYRGGGWDVQIPSSKIPKALQNRAKLNPIVKTVKNCWIRMPTP